MRSFRRIGFAFLGAMLGAVLAACASGTQSAPPADRAETHRAKEAAPAPTIATPPVPAPVDAAPAMPSPPPVDPLAELLARSGSESTSLGSPTNGRIEGAVALPDRTPFLIRNPKSPNPDGKFGTVELVQALVRAGARVADKYSGAELVVNDIGLPRGGEIEHHGSHESGRDADVLFYYRHAKGGAVFPAKGIPVEPDGTGWDYGDLADPKDDVKVRIDLPRTWAFAAALLEDEALDVQRIFLVEHVRTMLLDEAAKQKAKAATIARFADLTCQPSTAHDDHFHIRVYCTAEDIAAGCEDSQPIYPWHRAKLTALGTAPVIAKPQPRVKVAAADASDPKEENLDPMEAAAKSGAVHARVTAFLKRREAWLAQPHPGRLYCK
jgi:penicillin-insensitive murein endopeptidase